MKKLLMILFLFFASPAGAQVILGYPDPANVWSFAWGQLHYMKSVGKIAVWGGNSHTPFNNNTLYFFNPVGNGSWETPFPENISSCLNAPATSVCNRDNYPSFYIPPDTYPNGYTGDDLVYWGGSCANQCPPAGESGIWGPVASNPTTWRVVRPDDTAPSVLIKNFGVDGYIGTSDSGTAWDDIHKCGIIFGGGGNSPNNNLAGVCPNLGSGTQPLVMKAWTGPNGGSVTWPAERSQSENGVTALNGKFYLVGGRIDNTQSFCDLWVLDGAALASAVGSGSAPSWTKLTDLPSGHCGEQLAVSGDPDTDMVLVWGSQIFGGAPFFDAYDTVNAVWGSLYSYTPGECAFNRAVAYAPNVKKHFLLGGNFCNGNSVGFAMKGYSISGMRMDGTGNLILARGLWTSRPISALDGGFPARDDGQVKHMSFAVNPNNRRVYNFGGDWSVFSGNPIAAPSPSGATGSARNEIWSWGPLNNADVLEYPYCGFTTEITIGRATEVGVTFDTSRNVFWVMPGFMNIAGYGNPCTPPLATMVSEIITFNPTTQKFTGGSYTAEPVAAGEQHGKNAVYDPVHDVIWKLGVNGNGVVIRRYNIAANTWDTFQAACALDPHHLETQGPCPNGFSYINYADFSFDHFAFNPTTQLAYAPDGRHYNIIILDLGSCSGGNCNATIGAKPPDINPQVDCPSCLANHTMTDWMFFEWDSTNSKVLYPFLPTPNNCNPDPGNDCNDGLAGYPTLAVYDPVADSWSQTQNLTDIPGQVPRGNSFAFDSTGNYLVSYGGLCPHLFSPCLNDPFIHYYYIYRLGGTFVLPPSITLTVKSLNPSSGAAMTVTPNDINGQGNGTTQFTRVYPPNTAVTITAPSTLVGAAFVGWGGCDSVTGTFACHVSAIADRTLTAIYNTVTTTAHLTVASMTPNSGVTISYQATTGSCGGGSFAGTQFVLTCNLNSVVALTAPTQSGGFPFVSWGGCDSTAGPICNVNMGGDKTVTATYQEPVWPAAPINLTSQCSADNTSVALSWSTVVGATTYGLRLDLLGNSTSPDLTVDNLAVTNFTAPIQPQAAYNWWVFGVQSGNAGNQAAASFQCGAPGATRLQLDIGQGAAVKLGGGKSANIGTR